MYEESMEVAKTLAFKFLTIQYLNNLKINYKAYIYIVLMPRQKTDLPLAQQLQP